MRVVFSVIRATITIGACAVAQAKDGFVLLSTAGTNTLVQVQGSDKSDWFIQTSTDLFTWSNLYGGVPLLSASSNPPARPVGVSSSPARFYRAVRTEGLYDPALFRTLSLTFTQSNWGTVLANARTYDTNAFCSLVTMNNGATNPVVGARYKGNTSYSMAGTKKSINLEFAYVNTNADLMGYGTVNLNNAAGDESIMREALYFTVMSQYTPCPKGAMANVIINGSQWGVYSLVQQENGQLVTEWFPSNAGDRWRAPNAPAGTGGGGGFSSSNSAFHYFGNTNLASYTPHYTVKSDNSTTNQAFGRLINAIYVLGTTSTNQLRDKVEDVFAVDAWLWFLVLENVFVDDDSYWNKGADYGFYYEPESGRIHPVEHDGNEAFASATGINYSLSPVQGATGNNRPLLYRFLAINELRQRYLAHMRTVLEEAFNPAVATPLIDRFHALSASAINTDPNRGFTMTTYTNEIKALKTYITNRYHHLTNHAELKPLPPRIVTASPPTNTVTATDVPFVTAQVAANGTNGLNSVWLYFRGKSYGKFTYRQMFDDGTHGDGTAGDGTFGADTTNFPAGTKVRFYLEARSANPARAASFAPARAEQVTYSYRVAVTTASNTPVVINEVMAANGTTLADPQGDYDDWIELRNVTSQAVDLTGRHLSDEPNNPRKWPFPAGTTIPANGYLMVWADEDSSLSSATNGLHASFKLSSDGEELYFTDTDANFNQVLDSVSFGAQTIDRSHGRTAADPEEWDKLTPTPGQANQ